MTPEERKLVTDLFDRLATLEDAPRDPEAERLIRDGLRQAPNAVYALVQTTLVQDEALKRADAHIRELEGGAEPPRDKSFLGGVRDTLLGSRGSVPSVRPPDAPSGLSPAWRTGAQPMAPAPAPEPATAAAAPGRPGGSFLGTAAAAAAGMIGGSLLLSGIRGMMGGGAGGAHGAFNPTAGGSGGGPSPWGGGGGSIAGSDLSRQAGLDDMGRPPSGGGSGLLDATGSDAPFEEESGAGDFDEGGFDLDDMTGGGGDD